MHFQIVDTETAYHHLLAAPDAAARESIFRQELVAPFDGLIQTFGGGDGLTMFRQWKMSPEWFSAENREYLTGILATLARADAWKRAAASLEKGWAAFAPYADRIALESITFALCLAQLGDTGDDYGYSGFGGFPGWIMTVYGEPTPFTLERIEAATVHEMNHNVRFTLFPFNFMQTTVAEYMIAEGLAESFAAELYGAEMIGPWVSRFDDSRLEETKAIFRDGLELTGFNLIRGYIFGDRESDPMGIEKVGVPPFAGYALGYRVTQAYLKRTGKTAAEATFLPARQIIAESGFFD
ncbi:MAG: DUF2268 domain-containing protein [Anaerolineae bacterium]|nr:DUF2268 domain-containing protein [Anaerolineae bacterium]